MSETVKLIIEIPAETYEYWKTHRDEYVLAEAIGNGIPLDTVKDKILGYNVRQHVSGSESFLKGYAVGMDKSAEILDKISAEIKELPELHCIQVMDREDIPLLALDIIEKYKGVRE